MIQYDTGSRYDFTMGPSWVYFGILGNFGECTDLQIRCAVGKTAHSNPDISMRKYEGFRSCADGPFAEQ